MGEVQLYRKDYQAAAPLLQESHATFRQVLPDNLAEEGLTGHLLAIALTMTGNVEPALDLLEDLQPRLLVSKGPEHPLTKRVDALLEKVRSV